MCYSKEKGVTLWEIRVRRIRTKVRSRRKQKRERSKKEAILRNKKNFVTGSILKGNLLYSF